MLIRPSFFDDFKCLAADCRHTCCAGWEICVDEDTAREYERILTADELKRLQDSPDGILLCREGEKCGFLRDDGLCELIISHGEDILCDICREHPRFYSYSGNENICEAGVGAACEEAVALWLDNDIELLCEDDGYEADSNELEALKRQKKLISAALEGKLPKLDYSKLREVYSSMDTLEKLDFPERFEFALNDKLCRLAAYYIYRWYFEYPDTVEYFAAANCIMTAALGDDIYDSARKISCEVEYSPDNTELILEYLRMIKQKPL